CFLSGGVEHDQRFCPNTKDTAVDRPQLQSLLLADGQQGLSAGDGKFGADKPPSGHVDVNNRSFDGRNRKSAGRPRLPPDALRGSVQDRFRLRRRHPDLRARRTDQRVPKCPSARSQCAWSQTSCGSCGGEIRPRRILRDLRSGWCSMRELNWGIGKPVPRSEDGRLTTGRGRYTDDVDLGPAAAMYLVRSPHAAARIIHIDTVAAREAPGVLAVLTGEDVLSENLAPLPSRVARQKASGEPNFVPPYYPLAVGVAPHSGVAVVAVIAETLTQAKDAAELVSIDYDVLAAVTDTAKCLDDDAPVVWDSERDNCCFVFRLGDRPRVQAAFAGAAHVVSERFVISRMTANSIEPRNAIGHHSPKDNRYTLYSSLQSPHTIQREIAGIFRQPANRFRVVALDVGGSFGMKG